MNGFGEVFYIDGRVQVPVAVMSDLYLAGWEVARPPGATSLASAHEALLAHREAQERARAAARAALPRPVPGRGGKKRGRHKR